MGFNSLDYLIFLAISFVFYWQLYRFKEFRLTFLLLASYIFYFAWNGIYLFLIFVSTLIDYICGFFIYRYREKLSIKRTFLILSLITNFSILFFFKYYNFFIDNINVLLDSFAQVKIEGNLKIILPIGISFYTFQSLSYTFDIYLGKIVPINSFKKFALYVTFFPQLIAGPIVRASEFLPQFLKNPKCSKKDFGESLFLILRGLSKKIIIADFLASSIVNVIFVSPQTYSSVEVLIALIAFHFQVYCDFSGYTDIAIGSARLFGFILPENFNRPYAATSPANFWKRWHMTLSRYVFDYFYKIIGSERDKNYKKYFNILLTFSLIGFWHGASWTYVVFGVYHAIGVIMSHVLGGLFKAKKFSGTVSLYVKIILTNLFIIFSLPLFRAQTLKDALVIYERIFSFSSLNISFSNISLFVLLIAIISHYIPVNFNVKTINIFSRFSVVPQSLIVLIMSFLMYKVYFISTNTFIYFQF